MNSKKVKVMLIQLEDLLLNTGKFVSDMKDLNTEVTNETRLQAILNDLQSAHHTINKMLSDYELKEQEQNDE